MSKIKENLALRQEIRQELEAELADKYEAKLLSLHWKVLALTQKYREMFFSTLTDKDEEKLKDAHSQQYIRTDDEMPEEYEKWLERSEVEDLVEIIKGVNRA